MRNHVQRAEDKADGRAPVRVSPNGVRILEATEPVDFRKGHDGLAAAVQNELGLRSATASSGSRGRSLEHNVTVGGETHRRDKICRLACYPLVVTNSTAPLDAVHEELAVRAGRIHAARIVNGLVPASSDEWSTAFDRVDPQVPVTVATIPRGHLSHRAEETAEYALT